MTTAPIDRAFERAAHAARLKSSGDAAVELGREAAFD
jgi:hypothetical protein